MVDSWKIIPKGKITYTALTLIVENSKARHGYILKIPLRLRDQSEYFRDAKLSYVNLLEKGDLLMLQFVPKKGAEKDTHTIYYGGLYISKNVINYDMNGKKKQEIAYHLDKHNIIIDRKQFN